MALVYFALCNLGCGAAYGRLAMTQKLIWIEDPTVTTSMRVNIILPQ